MNTTVINFLVSIILSLTLVKAQGQTFTEIETNIPDYRGVADWGDFDNDGDLDLIITGSISYSQFTPATYLYRNMGNGQFEFVPGTNLTSLFGGAVLWLDFNNDGYLDVYLSGFRSYSNYQERDPKASVYAGNGTGIFTEAEHMISQAGFTSAACGDFNNDGTTDLALAGYSDVVPKEQAYIYENKNGLYTQSQLFNVQTYLGGSFSWGDYDNDNDLDLIQTGMKVIGEISTKTLIYRNDKVRFTLLNNDIIGGTYGSAEWGDFDKDGDLDFVATGDAGLATNIPILAAFRNDLNDQFKKLIMPTYGSIFTFNVARLGDFDNDGDLDLLTGLINFNNFTGDIRFYTYKSGEFTLHSTIPGLNPKHLSWADYDNDGDLDIFASGSILYYNISKLLQNDCPVMNTPPQAPQGLKSTVIGKQVFFSWEPATDDLTSSKNLTYNLMVGRDSDSALILSPLSDLKTGKRRVARPGNTFMNNSWMLNIDSVGSYYWKVQAVDNSFLGSEFSETGTFTIGVPYVVTLNPDSLMVNYARLCATVSPYNKPATVYFEYSYDSISFVKTDSVSISGNENENVKIGVDGIIQSVDFYYRAVARNEFGISYGNVLKFRTATQGLEQPEPLPCIYPNPASDGISLGCIGKGITLIHAINCLGQVVLKAEIEISDQDFRINTSHLKDGIYLLLIEQNNKRVSTKMVIKHHPK